MSSISPISLKISELQLNFQTLSESSEIHIESIHGALASLEILSKNLEEFDRSDTKFQATISKCSNDIEDLKSKYTDILKRSNLLEGSSLEVSLSSECSSPSEGLDLFSTQMSETPAEIAVISKDFVEAFNLFYKTVYFIEDGQLEEVNRALSNKIENLNEINFNDEVTSLSKIIISYLNESTTVSLECGGVSSSVVSSLFVSFDDEFFNRVFDTPEKKIEFIQLGIKLSKTSPDAKEAFLLRLQEISKSLNAQEIMKICSFLPTIKDDYDISEHRGLGLSDNTFDEVKEQSDRNTKELVNEVLWNIVEHSKVGLEESSQLKNDLDILKVYLKQRVPQCILSWAQSLNKRLNEDGTIRESWQNKRVLSPKKTEKTNSKKKPSSQPVIKQAFETKHFLLVLDSFLADCYTGDSGHDEIPDVVLRLFSKMDPKDKDLAIKFLRFIEDFSKLGLSRQEKKHILELSATHITSKINYENQIGKQKKQKYEFIEMLDYNIRITTLIALGKEDAKNAIFKAFNPEVPNLEVPNLEVPNPETPNPEVPNPEAPLDPLDNITLNVLNIIGLSCLSEQRNYKKFERIFMGESSRNKGAIILYISRLQELPEGEDKRNIMENLNKFIEYSISDREHQLEIKYRTPILVEGSHANRIFSHQKEGIKTLDLEKWHTQDRITQVSRAKGYITLTDDPIDLLLMGTEGKPTCLNVSHGAIDSRCLLANMIDPKNRIIVMKDDETGKIKGRAIIRALWDENESKPALFLEEILMQKGSEDFQDYLKSFAKEFSVDLGLELYCKGVDDDVLQGKTLKSFGSPAAFEKPDSLDSGPAIVREGVFSYSKVQHLVISSTNT